MVGAARSETLIPQETVGRDESGNGAQLVLLGGRPRLRRIVEARAAAQRMRIGGVLERSDARQHQRDVHRREREDARAGSSPGGHPTGRPWPDGRDEPVRHG